MAEEESKSFVIRDRRNRGDEEGESSKSGAAPASAARTESSHPAAAESAHEHESRPPVTFSSFIFSLGTSALMLMGEQFDPQQARMPVNLGQAKEIIDILSMLEDKTKGNLAADEESVLTDMLYALRMKYVDVASTKPAAKST